MVLVYSAWTSNASFVVVEIENLGVKKGGINAFSLWEVTFRTSSNDPLSVADCLKLSTF